MDDQIQLHPAAAPAAPRERLLLGLRGALAKWSGVHLKGFLDRLDQELFRLADRAGNNADQSRYWQTRAELISHREAIERRMSVRLGSAFQAFVDCRETWHTETSPTGDEFGLQLVGDEQLERSLALDTMSRRAAADCSGVLYVLHQRLSVLAAGQKVGDQDNPVAPRIFAEALDAGLAGLAIDNRARLLIYKFYEVQLMARLGKLYELLNHQLKSAGVLPNLRYTIVRDGAAASPLPTAGDPVSQRRQRQLMEALLQLQTSIAGAAAGNASDGSRDLAGMIGSLQLIAALGGLQRRAASGLEEAVTADQVAAVGATLQRQMQQQTDRAVDTDTVEIVGLLFKCILDDEQLPDSVKALLSCLHTLYLKLALADPAFFNSPQHPARQWLNALVAAGARWVEPEPHRKSEILQQMRRLVRRALEEFDDDIRLFSELLAELDALVQQHAERIRRAEQRAMESARGEDRLKEGRQQVEQFLRRRCAGVALTAAARELLFGPWAHYQTFIWLRFGTGSIAWEEAADAVDALVHYLTPRSRHNAEHERLLLAGLRSGLDMVGYDRTKGEALFEALARSRESDAPSELLRIEDVRPPEIEDDPELSQLVRLEFGTWLLFGADQPPQQQRRLKLAWHNRSTLRFMFVNRLGQQVALRHGAELAEELRRGSLRVLDTQEDKPFFEKALERMVAQLKSHAPAVTEVLP